MKISEFYSVFKEVDLEVSQLNAKIETKREEVRGLEKTLKTKKIIQNVLIGLEKTPREKDPGKYGPAFYFVEAIKKGDIQHSKKPSLYGSCPHCKAEQPVLMRYEQTYDSDAGDTWEKEAFIICQKDGIQSMARFTSEDRFL